MREVLDKIQEAEKQCPWDEISRGHFVYHWAKELKRMNLFKVCLPLECGGQNIGLVEFMEITRKLSFIDANLGWRFQIANGATYFFKNFQKEKALTLFNENELLVSGSGSNTGIAVPIKNGYNVSGEWDYCSGSDLASHVSFVFTDESTKEALAAIIPMQKSFTFQPYEFSGMQHTATAQFKLENLFVHSEDCFEIQKTKNEIELPAFEPEFDVFARAFFLPVAVGIFERYFYELSLTFSPKYAIANKSVKSLSDFKNEYFELLEKIKSSDLSNFSSKVTEIIKKMKFDLISSIHFAGMNGLKRNHPVNYTFQNFIAVTQHYLLN